MIPVSSLSVLTKAGRREALSDADRIFIDDLSAVLPLALGAINEFE